MASSRAIDVVDCRNGNGHGCIFYRYDGVLRHLSPGTTPGDDIKVVKQCRELELRDDDIMIVAYPKCGTHWLWEIVTMILHGRVEYSTNQKEVAMLGLALFGKPESLPSPRVLNSHNYFRHLPASMVHKKIKTIHIMRNPKDVSVSGFHHENGLKAPNGFEGSYTEYLDLFLDGKVRWGPFFDYIRDWQQVSRDHPDLPLLNLFYEDLKKKPIETIHSIACFLDKPISNVLCEDIAIACEFSRLKFAAVTLKDDCLGGAWSVRWKDEQVKIYRKGVIGDWKNWLTVAQNERFDDVLKEEMKNTEITFIYE